jgi:hypothetical protein
MVAGLNIAALLILCSASQFLLCVTDEIDGRSNRELQQKEGCLIVAHDKTRGHLNWMQVR